MVFLLASTLTTGFQSAWTAPIVRTSLGPIAGKVATARDNTAVALYFGVPFAAPPLGELRFAPPVAHPPWNATRQATSHGHCCVQSSGLGDEDCLVLDVYVPAAPATIEGIEAVAEVAEVEAATVTASPAAAATAAAARPVMVWFYGGGFVKGCASDFDATELAAAVGAIVVVVNYRLSALGFLGLPEPLAGGEEISNAGLRDMQAGLQWVRDNAAAYASLARTLALALALALVLTLALTVALTRTLTRCVTTPPPSVVTRPR